MSKETCYRGKRDLLYADPGFTSQQIAEIIPEAVSNQKGTIYVIYSNFKCNGNIIHININDYTIIEKYDNNIIVDKVIDGSDIFINGKIVDDFNILDKNYIYIRLMYQLPNNFREILWSKKMK